MRARSIKPGICTNELLGRADPYMTLLFERLWMIADREGRLEDRPDRIKVQAFPYRPELDIEQLLEWLDANGFVRRYAKGSARYIQVIEFAKHQHPHVHEKPSTIPAPDSHHARTVRARDKAGASTVQAREEHRTNPSSSLTPSSLTPDSGLLTTDSSEDLNPSATVKNGGPATAHHASDPRNGENGEGRRGGKKSLPEATRSLTRNLSPEEAAELERKKREQVLEVERRLGRPLP